MGACTPILAARVVGENVDPVILSRDQTTKPVQDRSLTAKVANPRRKIKNFTAKAARSLRKIQSLTAKEIIIRSNARPEDREVTAPRVAYGQHFRNINAGNNTPSLTWRGRSGDRYSDGVSNPSLGVVFATLDFEKYSFAALASLAVRLFPFLRAPGVLGGDAVPLPSRAWRPWR
jgi:hypothetical protein